MTSKVEEYSYGSIFALMVVIAFILAITYISGKQIYLERMYMDDLDNPETKEVVIRNDVVEPTQLLPNDTVLYDNLTDAEAEMIIKELLRSGEENEEKIRALEAVVGE